MILDCFNEALDYIRPYGIKGKPLSWLTNSSNISFQMVLSCNIDKVCSFAISRILNWGTYLCGFLPQQLEEETGEYVQIEQEYLTNIQRNRLDIMVANEVSFPSFKSQMFENEDLWTSYELEHTEALLIVSEALVSELALELVLEVLLLRVDREGSADDAELRNRGEPSK